MFEGVGSGGGTYGDTHLSFAPRRTPYKASSSSAPTPHMSFAAPAPTRIAAAPVPPPIQPPPPPAAPATGSFSGGGSGGGGGGLAAAATAVAARPTLEDYIKNNFLYTGVNNQNERNLDEFDAQTLRGRQDVEAEQGLRRHTLQDNLDDAGQANAEDLAGRGLLRSGINFQNQDRINQEGEQGQNRIAQLLTDFITQRQGGRQQQVSANQSALNQQIAALTEQFNKQNVV